MEVVEPGRRDTDSAVQHKLGEQRVQLVILDQGLLLYMPGDHTQVGEQSSDPEIEDVSSLCKHYRYLSVF